MSKVHALRLKRTLLFVMEAFRVLRRLNHPCQVSYHGMYISHCETVALTRDTDVLCYTRLVSSSLPTGRNLRRVVEQYFANVHPLRCFAFVHKPSFMRQLDKGFTSDDESALLHIICAHGAK